MKNYRVRRPKEYEGLMNDLKDSGVFDTLKSVLVFAAAVGFKNSQRTPFAESSERIDIKLFSENSDQPFIYCIALAEHDDVDYLREDRFEDMIETFEEYAAGGLKILESEVDRLNIKESIQSMISQIESNNLIEDIASEMV